MSFPFGFVRKTPSMAVQSLIGIKPATKRGSVAGIPGSSSCWLLFHRVAKRVGAFFAIFFSSSFLKWMIASLGMMNKILPWILHTPTPNGASFRLAESMIKSFVRQARVRGVCLLKSSEYRVLRDRKPSRITS